MFKSAFAALALLLAAPAMADPFDAPLPEDPIAEIEGIWHSDRYKMAVEVKDGVATITEMNSSHATPRVYNLREGLVIARMDGHKVLHNRGIQFSGAGWQRGGGSSEFRLQDGCSCSMGRFVRKGTLYWQLNLIGISFLRREFIDDSLFEGRE